jgi:ABC-2 type transport system permease protein
MAHRDPLLPNAGIIARREYRDRVRSRLYLASTIILAGLALLVALAPIAIRYMDQQTVTRIAVVASEPGLGASAVSAVDTPLNQPPAAGAPKNWTKPFAIEATTDAPAADAALLRGSLAGILILERGPTGQIQVTYRTNGTADPVRAQLVGFAAIAVSIYDWTASQPTDPGRATFQAPTFTLDAVNTATNGGARLDQQQTASRAFLGIVFVVLLFITVVIYGMWVATGVAAEKSSRVMELMISAASPRQMLTGKVVGIGGAGLTQYLAIAIPALVLLAFQDRVAAAVLGPGWADRAPLVGLTPALLLGYGVFFLLGFTLFPLIYASMGSFVSRPDDLQTLSLPLSLVAMVGYLSGIVALGGSGGAWIRIASFLPPFSPFVMLARLMVAAVEPWEIVLSIVLLLVAIAGTAVVATRMYAAGVLLYGTRPGLRAFVAAARRAG